LTRVCSIFSQMLQLIPRVEFESVVRKYRPSVTRADSVAGDSSWRCCFASLETIRQAFRSGGRGYVVKSDAAKELVVAVRAVSEKKRYTNARYVAQL